MHASFGILVYMGEIEHRSWLSSNNMSDLATKTCQTNKLVGYDDIT